MTQEEKAKRYDEVVKEIKGFFEGKQKMPNDVDKTLELLFPELKEDNDEKIRKAIVSGMTTLKELGKETFATININDCISWLEKQGEQKNKINSYNITFEDVLVLECCMKTIKITEGCDELYEMLVPLYDKIHNAYLVEKQSEQKPQGKSTLEVINEEKVDNANKAEPKDYSSIDPHFFKPTDKTVEEYNITGIGSKHAQGKLGEMIKNLKSVNETLEQKPAWSEEDETSIAVNNPDAYKIGFADGEAHAKEEQWKPSDEQMETLLSEVTAWKKGCPKQKVLESLYQDLKKL